MPEVGTGVGVEPRVAVGSIVGVGAGVTVGSSDNLRLTTASTVAGISGVCVGVGCGAGVATTEQPISDATTTTTAKN